MSESREEMQEGMVAITREALAAKLTALNEERDDLWRKIHPLQERIHAITDEIRPLREELGALDLIDHALDWPWLLAQLADDRTSSMAVYHHFENVLREHFDMYHSGRWTDTNEPCLKVKVEPRQKGSAEKNLRGVLHFLSMLTPHDDGLVWFGIFEDSLSAHGSFKLCVSPDASSAVLRKTTYGSTRDLKTFDSVSEAIEHIAGHLPYDAAGWRDEDEESEEHT